MLLLDEPTNHLDMESKAVLQQALIDFPGTLILVSHDRDFLDPIVTEVLEVTPGKVRMLTGNVSDYVKQLDVAEVALSNAEPKHVDASIPTIEGASQSRPQLSGKERRKLTAELRQRLAPLKKKHGALEKTITELQQKIQAREAEMMDPAWFKQGGDTAAGMKELDTWKSRLDRTEMEWLELEEKISEEEAKAQ